MNVVPGISGMLLPARYRENQLESDTVGVLPPLRPGAQAALQRWWVNTEASCGPATGLHALFDLAAMPLFALLGFQVRDPDFRSDEVRMLLWTPQETPVAAILLPWATRPSSVWRDIALIAHGVGAAWGVVFAPPFLSLVNARGYATRRSVDFAWPAVSDERALRQFWTLTSASAFDAEIGANTCPLDTLVSKAERYQHGVREDLQEGVVLSLGSLTGVIARERRFHVRGRTAGRDASQRGAEMNEALTIVYRVLFLLFAESRDLAPVHDPVYGGAYAVGTLCREAIADEHGTGLWDALGALTRLSRMGCHTEDLIVEPFNGHLFARRGAPSLEAGPRRIRRGATARGRDRAMGRALVALGSRPGRAGREDICYRDLGVEQLGAVYERVLDLDAARLGPEGPVTSGPGGSRARGRLLAGSSSAGHSGRRKQTGTFYTPQPLAEFVVRRTLAPLVAGATADAILALRVVDPAMGSGAFLVAACRYLASAYERALIEEGRASAASVDEPLRCTFRRLVAERCLAGVDVNPVAVQLARLSLWLTTLSAGKPLSFLDHRLRAGNSLVGASPDDLRRVPTLGRARHASLPLFDTSDIEHDLGTLSRAIHTLSEHASDSIASVRFKEALWLRLSAERSPFHAWRTAANLWCARWFWPASASGAPSSAELRALLDAVLKRDRALPAALVATRLKTTHTVAEQHGFFHWPIEFADVFFDDGGQPCSRPGFDAVIGNPPWEMLRRDPPGGQAGPGHHDGCPDSSATNRGTLVQFIRESGLYPSCNTGHVNLYQPFVERALSLTRPGGRVGLIVPWGLAADDGSATLRTRLIERTAIDTLVGLDNSASLFPIHRGLRFVVLVTSPGSPTRTIRARFGVRTGDELDRLPARDDLPAEDAYPVHLTPARLKTIGGPSLRVPDVRDADELELVERWMARFPRLGAAAGWAAEFGRELNATEAKPHLGTRGMPVVEGKHLGPFSVHAAQATSFITVDAAERVLPSAAFLRPRLGYRDVAGVSNRLMLIAAMVPAEVVTTHTIFCLKSQVTLEQQHFLCGLFNSYVLNAVVRLLMGGHVTTTLVEGLPVPTWTGAKAQQQISRLAHRIATRHEPVAVDKTSLALQAGIQARVAHMYGLARHDFERLLESFPRVPQDERRAAARAFREIIGG